ncbi:MAG TPA: hypothetical protein VK607_02630, partial [Kofleriaceae bacterium]|nr:hypothetical protein [Kofleriaceae bacterium]
MTQTSGGDGAGPGKHTLTEQLGDGTPGASHEPWHGPMRVTTNGLNVRSSPSKHGRENIIGVLHHHANIEARGREGEWVKTDYRSKAAFVFGGYLAPVGKPAGAAHAKTPAATPAAPAAAEPHHDAPAAAAHADDPEHVSPVPPTAPADGAHDAAKPKEAEKAAATPGTTTTPKPPAPAEPQSPPPATGTGHPPLPLDHMAKFVYEVHVGSATQKVMVFVSAGQLTLTPDVFMFFHGQWANYGIDPRQLAERKAAEQARIAKDKADPNKDPKKIRGDETEAYVESGRNSAEEAMQHAQNRNVISILPQGVMGGGGSAGGHMSTLTAKGGGLPALIDAVMVALQKDLHGDKLKPGRISIAGHSAGGYMGIHEALANAGDMKDTITDVTLMDAEYNGAQFANASSWLLQGKPGKSFRITASGKQ